MCQECLIPEANRSPCGIQLMRSTAAVAVEFKTWMLLGSDIWRCVEI